MAKRGATRHALALTAVIGFTWLAYSNAIHAPLFYDNQEVILKDPRVHTLSSIQLHRLLTQQYWETSPTGLYRPVTTLSFLLNYTVLGNGSAPEGYHWFNFTVHAINIALVYALGLAIFGDRRIAMLVSAVWGAHPVLTESVTNIVGRSDMLAGGAVLAAVLCHRCALRASGVRKAAWLAVIALAVAAGMFSKESAIVAIAVLALYDVAFERTASWRARMPSYLAVAAPCLAYLAVRTSVLAHSPYQPTPFVENPLLGADFWTASLTAVKVIGEYVRLLVWPVRLSCDYSYNQIPLFGWRLGDWENWKALLALTGCASASVVALRSYPRRKPLFFAIGFFFAALSPTSNLFIRIGTIMAERFLYLPSVAFILGVAYVLRELWRLLPAGQPAYRQAAKAAGGVLLIACAARTYDRNGDWADPQRFWRTGVEAAPNSYKAHMNAVNQRAILRPEDLDRSVGDAKRALAILQGLPDSENAGDAYLDTATFYRSVGEHVAAKAFLGQSTIGTAPAQWYRQALEAVLHSERIALAWDARCRLENQRRGKPGLTSLPSKLYLEMGRIYAHLDDPRRALQAFERGRALESDPDLLEEAASAYTALGEPHQAALALVEALAVDQSRGEIAPKLIELYGQLDPGGCSVSSQGGAPGLNPDCPLVHRDICAASRNVAGSYERRGQQFEAGEIRRIASSDLGCAAELLR